ncbi:unannotated protein [freshwater metagenome]|uniref:Unannotated protein n=1 Tax=freshwater metagenome TaxID=449393 RepID=A0A6J6FTM8_9ZZZZ
MTTAVSASKSTETFVKSGWALYQGTKSAAEMQLLNSSPGMPNLRPIVDPVANTTAS